MDDIAGSLGTEIVRGHHRVHEVEIDLVRRARERRNEKLMVVDLWNFKRTNPFTSEYEDLQREIDAFAHRQDSHVTVSTSSRPESWDRHLRILRRRPSAQLLFFTENPLQCDALLTDDEVVLTFPRPQANRSFAIRIRGEAAVEEMWEIFSAQVGEQSPATHFSINTPEGRAVADQHMKTLADVERTVTRLQ